MDLQEWELLPDDGFLEIHDDGGKQIFSRKYVNDSRSMFKMNYFPNPSSKSAEFVELTEHSVVPKQLLPLPIQLEPSIGKNHDHNVVKEVTKLPIEISITPSAMSDKVKGADTGPVQADQDPISKVFFKKMMESEKFVDMKVDSPRTNNIKGVIHQVDPCTFQFESKENSVEDEALESENDRETVKDEVNSGNLKIWKWSLSGIGAICSFGVAAATIYFILFGGRLKNNKQHHQQALKLPFHRYTDDKRIKRVVRHATRLNEAISAATGVPIATAHFTLGGCYDGCQS